MKRYREAIDHYRVARERADDGLRMKIDYALGNATLAMGGSREALKYYDSCISARVFGSTYESIRSDARMNRLFAIRQADRLPDEPDKGDSGGSGSRSQGDGPEVPGKPSPSNPNGDSTGSKPSSSDHDGGSPSGKSAARSGGAGGSGSSATNSALSPRTRLAEAMEDLRESLQRRIADEPNPTKAASGKDW